MYTKYKWEQHKKHDRMDAILKKAGKKWAESRPEKQQNFISNCIKALREKLDVEGLEESEILFLINELGSSKQRQHVDDAFAPHNYKFDKRTIIGCIMLTQGYRTHRMVTEEEMRIDDDMSIPTT